MKLVRFEDDGQPHVGALLGDRITALSSLDRAFPTEMPDVLALGAEPVEDALRDWGGAGIPVRDVRLLAPIARPSKILAVGLNYADHVAETGREAPDFPVVFAKMPSCLVGANDPIERPATSTQLDWEGELAFVIGRRCRHVRREEAASVIAGYTIINDVTVRDWQHKTSQWTLGKSFDTHGPIGPCIVTGDELDPHALAIRTLVNGEVRQASNTKHLIFDCHVLVETLSMVLTLEPGDVVATGTPGGVGSAMNPPTFLEPGDTVRVEIEGIGAIENTVVQEQPTARRIR